ncbi:hypothetical protein TNCV_4119611 [Trichonephila clavipes]|nr:hypothetical protein TNCV_4119611 [Trichonephila clavipes]
MVSFFSIRLTGCRKPQYDGLSPVQFFNDRNQHNTNWRTDSKCSRLNFARIFARGGTKHDSVHHIVCDVLQYSKRVLRKHPPRPCPMNRNLFLPRRFKKFHYKKSNSFKSVLLKLSIFATQNSIISYIAPPLRNKYRGSGSPVVKVSDHGRYVMSSSTVPLKTRRVGQLCTLNLLRAEASSRWCGLVVRLWGASTGVVHVT